MERRILYLGQKPIGEKCFDLLLEAHWNGLVLRAIGSNMSKNGWWKSNSIFAGVGNTFPFVDNAEPHEDALIRMCELEAINTIVSVQHPHLLSARVLDMVHMEAYNLHLAPLPEYKGYNGHSFAILNSDKQYGVTIHKMEPAADSGDIVEKQMFDIEPSDTALSLYKKSEYWAEVAFRRFIDKLKTGQCIETVPQQGSGQYHGHRSLDAFRRVPAFPEPETLDRVARAFWFPPFEPAYFQFGERKLYLIPQWPTS